jgi:hypothetical protein
MKFHIFGGKMVVIYVPNNRLLKFKLNYLVIKSTKYYSNTYRTMFIGLGFRTHITNVLTKDPYVKQVICRNYNGSIRIDSLRIYKNDSWMGTHPILKKKIIYKIVPTLATCWFVARHINRIYRMYC